MPKATGYTPASGPPADRSGVASASITEKARPSSHSPAPHSDNMALIHTSATTAPAASPITQNGLIGRHGSEPSSAPGAVGKAITAVSAQAGAAVASQPTAASRSTTHALRRTQGIRRRDCGLDMAQVPPASRDSGVGTRPDRRRRRRLRPGADHPPILGPGHALAVGDGDPRGLLDGDGE